MSYATNFFLLARDYDRRDPAGWLLAEKLDGVRARWDGHRLLSRSGRTIEAPAWFMAGLPAADLDGELWAGRGRFDFVSGVSRRKLGSKSWREDDWKRISFRVFDAPSPLPFADRLQTVAALDLGKHAEAVKHTTCASRRQMYAIYKRIIDGGGEGIVLRDPKSPHATGRPGSLLRIKPNIE